MYELACSRFLFFLDEIALVVAVVVVDVAVTVVVYPTTVICHSCFLPRLHEVFGI